MPASGPEIAFDPRRYFESVGETRHPVAGQPPVCLYLEITNRCNLLCETCPRTFDELEPPADMPWELFCRIVDQFPAATRAVLHGVGEPMLVRDLARRVRYLKERGFHVLFNTNGTLLTEKRGRELTEAGLDELRVSLDAADRATFRRVRGRDDFDRIVRNVAAFVARQREAGATRPAVSLWLTGLKETVAQLESFVRLAHRLGVGEVYLQRLVFFPASAQGLARESSALFERLSNADCASIASAKQLADSLGVRFEASGATEPGTSVRHSEQQTWAHCRRPWTVMYFTAHGRALPCCIAPFSHPGYQHYTLGDATVQTLREIWNGSSYRAFREALLADRPPPTCASCGLRWSL